MFRQISQFSIFNCQYIPGPGGHVAVRRGGIVTSLIIALLGVSTMAGAMSAARARPYKTTRGGSLVINGTSTFHNWTAKSQTLIGTASFTGRWTGHGASAISLQAVDLTIPVKSLKSSEGGGMDGTMYSAMHRRKHPLATYQLTKAKLERGPTDETGTCAFKTLGVLTINGVAKNIRLVLNVARLPGGGMTITTGIKLKMTDFGITPPTAMFGVIRSGNAITITATWNLAPKKAGT